MSRSILALLLALACLLAVPAVSAHTPEQIRAIEQSYARLHDGRMIPDDQLEYYLDRSDAGWSLDRISRDMELATRTYVDNPWRPAPGWIAREVVCSSLDNRYRECPAPFRGTAVITAQISQSSCIEGRSWGQRPGMIWVNRGCRARFGIIRTAPDARTFVCQSTNGRYRQCNTGFRGRVQLVSRLADSRACIEGRTWGQREGMVWVSRGCRARFASIGRPGSHDDDGQWMNNFYVVCASTGGTPTRCSWDGRYGYPRLSQQLSTAPCIEGRTWGYYADREHIWVSAGCRARFVSSQTGWNRGQGENDRDDGPWPRDNDR